MTVISASMDDYGPEQDYAHAFQTVHVREADGRRFFSTAVPDEVGSWTVIVFDPSSGLVYHVSGLGRLETASTANRICLGVT